MSPLAYVLKRCHELGYDSCTIRSPARHREYVIVRAQIATELRDQGHSYPAIGRAMNRDHATVIHLVKRVGPRRAP